MIRLLSTLFLSFATAAAFAAPPEIHISKGHWGIEFKHFELVLTPENTILPRDPRINREPLDESAEQFKYGQFEVFVPVEVIDLPTTCGRYYILRMPQTIDVNDKAEIQRKQRLFYDISRMVGEKEGTVRVVLEYPKGCNLFFRSGTNGQYVDYVGQLKK